MVKDYYWLNDKSRTFLSRGYLKDGQSAEERIKEIADNAQKILGISGFSEKFQRYMSRGFYSLATPIWTNFGNARGLPVSCFNSHVSDNMESILEKVGEVGMMSKYGGGTSGFFGELRGRGTSISAGGESSGPVHFMELFDKVASVVSQGSARRGSFAAYLPVEHPDIEEFLRIRSDGHEIQEMSIGVTISDAWMESMINGDKDKRKVWAAILKKRAETGYPYIFFSDTVNNAAPKEYKDRGLKINASNLCVVGDTEIEIIADGDKKRIRIRDLGFYIDNFNEVLVLSKLGDESCFNRISAFAQTGESSEIIEIEDEHGNILKCTPEHKIFTKNRGYVEAQHLKEEDILDIA
jgi:ribonucleoside-diphosphate reductase alpha chain